MSKDAPAKVFWSWQSDNDEDTGRYFVREVLNDVAKQLKKFATDEPERESDIGPIEIDHDTQGLGGSPPIADAILEKIREAAIFVADVTPVGVTGEGKLLANPNVMIELGYALHVMGHKRILMVINSAYMPKLDTLPFDLRHLKGPMVYDLPPNPTHEQRAKAKDQLAAQFKGRLKYTLTEAKEGMAKQRRQNEKFVEFELEPVFNTDLDLQPSQTPPPGLEEIKAQYPLLTVPARDPAPPRSRFPKIQGMPNAFPVPISQWTIKEVQDYNARLSRYYDRYEVFLKARVGYLQQLARAVTVKIALSNVGTQPAHSVRAQITFPPGVVPYTSKNFPTAPTAPTAPAKNPDGEPATFAHAQFPHEFLSAARFDAYRTDVDSQARTVDVYLGALKHHYMKESDEFHVVFATQADVKEHELAYWLTADENPEVTHGTMRFIPPSRS